MIAALMLVVHLLLAQASSPSVPFQRFSAASLTQLRINTVIVRRYPVSLAATARFPEAIVSRATIARIPVYLPRSLPASAPQFARVTAIPGLYRQDLTFTPECGGAHACLYATMQSATTIVPLEPNEQIEHAGQTMIYHKPICTAYCGPGGLYFTKDGVQHAIEVRGAQLPLLLKLYDSYAKVQ